MKLRLVLPLLAVMLAPSLAFSQQEGAMDHSGHAMPAQAAQDDSAATTAFRDINARMHRDMDIRYTNDVDVDFVRNMIPHHEGAVAMAEVVLEHSKDEELRKLAEDIVAAQQAEIAQMKAFLERKGASR